MRLEDYVELEKNPYHKEIRRVQLDLALYMFHESRAKSLLYENLEFAPLMTDEVLDLYISKIHKHLEARNQVQHRSTHPLKKYVKKSRLKTP